jgi:hypothetical protein
MKEPAGKKPFYMDRNFLVGFGFSLVIVVLYFFLVAPPARLNSQQTSTPQPGQPVQTSTPQQNGGWQPGITFTAPGSSPSDLLKTGDEIWIFTEEGKKLTRVNLAGKLQSETTLETLCSKAAWDGEALWCTEMSSRVTRLDAATGKWMGAFETEIESVQAIAWDGESLWLMTQGGGLGKYDRDGKQLESWQVGKFGFARDLVWAGGELWVAHIPPLLVQYDAQLKQVAQKDSFCGLSQGLLEYAIDWDGESLWFLDYISGQVTQCLLVD